MLPCAKDLIPDICGQHLNYSEHLFWGWAYFGTALILGLCLFFSSKMTLVVSAFCFLLCDPLCLICNSACF